MGAGLGAAFGLAGGVSKFFEGRSMQRRAQRMIDNFEWQDLENPYKDLQVSTLGAELQTEEAGRMAATAVDATRQGGSRAIIGGLGRIVGQNNLVNRQIAADLDRQQKEIDFAAAQDDTQIRAMQEKRQADELQGYGQMLNVGMNMKYGGIGDVTNAVSAGGQAAMTYASRNGGMGGTMGNKSTVQDPTTSQANPLSGIDPMYYGGLI